MIQNRFWCNFRLYVWHCMTRSTIYTLKIFWFSSIFSGTSLQMSSVQKFCRPSSPRTGSRGSLDNLLSALCGLAHQWQMQLGKLQICCFLARRLLVRSEVWWFLCFSIFSWLRLKQNRVAVAAGFMKNPRLSAQVLPASLEGSKPKAGAARAMQRCLVLLCFTQPR